jgi:hypothetical protein
MALREAVTAAVAALSLVVFACNRSGSQGEQPAATGDTSSFIDNGDGSVTDVATGLIWEKKCDCPGSLHHYETVYRWSADGREETIWDWLDGVNAEGGQGFAGHGDWRIPNVKELVSLVDYERADPAITALFDSCETPCGDPTAPACACTGAVAYWTSTTFADFPAHALVVEFSNGGVDDHLKTRRALVRAVRGPVAARAATPQTSESGTGKRP